MHFCVRRAMRDANCTMWVFCVHRAALEQYLDCLAAANRKRYVYICGVKSNRLQGVSIWVL